MTTPSRVLVIDDEPIARDSVEALLFGEGYDLYFASSGAEGLEIAERIKPDAVVLDVMMPGMDGFETCKRLRASPALAQVAIVMVTALDDRRSRLMGLSSGADEFLSKPFDSLELKIRLQTIARLGRYRRLVAEQQRFEWLVDRSEDGFLLLNAEGQIDYANPRSRTYLNLADGDIGADFMACCARYYQLEPTTAWQQWKQEPLTETPRYLVQAETPTARAFWLQVERFSQTDADGIGTAVRLRNVTAQMSNYQDIRRFHTTVVHKLRTPLIAMHGSFSLLKNYAGDMAPEEIDEFVNAAIQGIERLSSEIDDILGYIGATTISGSGESLTTEDLGVQIARLAGEVGIERLSYHCAPPAAVTVLPLSAKTLDTIVWEILENAKKFHPRHEPEVVVEVSMPAPTIFRLRFSDNGVTLSPEQLEWVWTPYVQAEKYFTGESPGMGLGLPLVATLVWQAGGEVRMYNRHDAAGVVVELDVPQNSIQEYAARMVLHND